MPALKDRRWIYVDLVLSDNRPGALIFEKGANGEAVFRQVFQAWGD